MLTLAAFGESIDPANVFQEIAGVPDDHLTVSGDDIIVPPDLDMLAAAAAFLNDATGVRAQVFSPNLRLIAPQDVEPLVRALIVTQPSQYARYWRSPRQLRVNESLNALVQSDPAAAAQHYVLAWLADGAVQPVEGAIFSVRATGLNVGAANAWTTMALTFATDLQVGRYQIVGARGWSLTGTAFRFLIVGNPWRPGFLNSGVPTVEPGPEFRYGGLGVWGEFDTTRPPQIEILGPAGAVPVFILDLIGPI